MARTQIVAGVPGHSWQQWLTLECSLCLRPFPFAASPIDTILDKEHYTLEDLLDDDELIQECKSLNARLTTFLKHRETVEKLVRSSPPPPKWPQKRRPLR